MNEPTNNFFVPERIAEANAEWRCNCGPAAFAAITRTEIEWTRKFFPDFPEQAWTNFADMENALLRRKKSITLIGPRWPKHGVTHVWWAIPKKGYRMQSSHWVACITVKGVHYIYDMNDRLEHWWGGWQTLANWEATILPLLLADYGGLGYRLTRSYEVE